MGLEEKLKKFYYTLEDAYYGVLDKINRHIPIYKVIDPIDKYVPSFMLFLLIIFLLVFWFVFLPILAPLIFPPVAKYYTASIKLVDSESAEPLKDVNITVKLVDYNQVLTEKTNEEGIASFEIPAEEVNALLSISHEGYEEIKEKQITLLADEVLTLELKRTGLYFAENKIEIYVYGKISGTVKQISDRTITITFQCQIGTPPTPINSHGSEQPFEVIRPKGCEGLSGTARAEGFKPQTKSLEGKTKVTFVLEEISSGEAKGDIEVTVYEYDYSYASDVIVRLYDAKTVSLITQKTTDASGTAVFKELKPGYYDIGVIADDGRTATKRNVEVNAGETTSVSITLPEPEVKAKKLFFKLLNEQNDEPVENARAFVYADDMFLDVFYSDAEGIVEYPIDTSIEDANFSALIAHPNFLPKRAYLNVLSIDATEPQVIKLRPKSTMISDYAPIAVIRADKYYGEAPLEVEFDASESFDPDGSIIEYLWDFGDGAKGSGVIVKHTFEESKEYEVKLTVVDDSGLIGETSVKIQVSLTQYAPVAIISADPWFGFAPLTVTFDASESTDPDGNIVSYEWNFGDGTTSTEKTVEHTYTQQGNYTVTLTVTDDDDKKSTATAIIQVREYVEGENLLPVAIFYAEPAYGIAPLTVTFDATGSYDIDGEIVNYRWDFNDGVVIEGKELAVVTHKFVKEGNYTVTLTVTDNNNGSATFSSAVYVLAPPEPLPPHAEIIAEPSSGEPPLSVVFDASESFDFAGSIVSYQWDFGDGNTASGITVQHTYHVPGTYTVTLTVTNDYGLSSEAHENIYVLEPGQPSPPNAEIRASSYAGFAPLTVTFDASESTDPDGNIVSYEWNFGDGTTSTEKTVEHTYTQQGNYTVTLTVTDDDGLQDTESTEIRVLPPEGIDIPPIIILNVDYPIGQAPLSVTFDASNSYDPDSPEKELYYKWDFGDGTSTEGEGEATVMHIFEEPGNYNVELTVEDDEEQTSTQTVLIQVTEQPVSNFGKIVAFVVDSEGMPVEGAELWLYREDASYAIFPSPGEHIYTDSEGKYEFDYLEPSVYPYFVRASKEGLFAESDHIIVSAGETETLTVVLEKGYGEIKAIVVDEENNPITNAEVSLFDSITNELLNSCVTDLGGSCVLRPLEAGILVYLRACKEDYLCALSEDIQVIANNQHEVKLTLSKQPDPMPEKGVEISFKALCKDWECTEYATSVNSLEDSEKYYYAKFELTLFSDESQQVEAYFIAGAKDKEALLAEGYKIKILELRTAAASETWYATCFNPTDPYEILLECVTSPNSGAKLSKIIWDKVVAKGGVTIPITVKFAVEPGLNAGDMLELHYAARAMQAGEQIIAEEKTQSFEIGALICSGNSINWKFSLYKDDVPISEDISSEDTVELTLGEEYTLKFIAKNCTEEDYTGAKLEIWNENVPDAIEFPEFGPGSGPYTVYESIPYFAPNDSIEHSVKILAKHPAEFTYVKLKISKGSDIPSGGLASIKFRVLTGKEMLVEGLPDSLSPGIPITLEGYVKDADTLEGIENAVVTIYRNESILATLITESSATNKGYFYFAQDPSEEGPKAGDAIKLHITHPEYNDLIITIPVRAEPISEFACVTIEPSEPMSVTKGQSASFTITTNNCPDKLHVKLDSLLSLEKAEEVLEETDSKQIGFTASGDRVYQGIYPIYIKGKFVGSSSSQFRNIGVFDVLVTDPSSCFEMNTYVYNLKSGEASGTIKNKCIVPYADPQMPRLSIDKSAVELSTEPEPDGITLTWRIRSYAKEALSSGNVNEIALTSYEETREVTFNGSYTFVLGTFNAIDYIEGNDEKGITGLKEAPNYSGGYLYDVKFVPESSNERVVVWIEGNLIKGKYIGTKETEGIYDFTIKNKYLQSTEYAFVTIQDYVASGGGE